MTREEAIKEAYGIPVTKAQHEALQILIPELAENDDERIRKELISFVNKYYGEETKKEVIAYLEKQKEQQPVKIDDDTEVGLDRALQIVKAAKGNLCGYQSDDGIYECCHAIQTLEHILKNGIEQKPAEWSEEEQSTISFAVDWLTKMLERTNVPEAKRDIESVILGLKSLRPQPHWKPSKEQINALKVVARGYPSDDLNAIESLLNDLQKLF